MCAFSLSCERRLLFFLNNAYFFIVYFLDEYTIRESFMLFCNAYVVNMELWETYTREKLCM